MYVGITDDIQERAKEHKLKRYPDSFTAAYNSDKLVYLDEFEDGLLAVKHESQFKKWKREWKVKLIEEQNPSWSDVIMNWSCDLTKFRN